MYWDVPQCIEVEVRTVPVLGVQAQVRDILHARFFAVNWVLLSQYSDERVVLDQLHANRFYAVLFITCDKSCDSVLVRNAYSV